jgi:hypothetical protein
MVMDKPMTKVLIYGGNTGWIGGLMHDMCKEKGTLLSLQRSLMRSKSPG